MTMEQEQALNALAGTMALLASTTSPRMTADLILRATSTPGAYIFSELLCHPTVQSLSSHPEYQPHLRHLEIFSHGTYQDYVSPPHPTGDDDDDDALPPLPPLNDAQNLKLRQLTLLTLASDRTALSYKALQFCLSLSSARELEVLVVGAVYANLLAATLDPARQVVCITSVSPLRDLDPVNSIPHVRKGLAEWSARCTGTLRKLEEEIAGIREVAVRRAAETQRQEAAVDKLVDAERFGGGNSSSAGAGGGRDNLGRKAKRAAALGSQEDDGGAMDLDDDDDGGEKKRGRRKLLQG